MSNCEAIKNMFFFALPVHTYDRSQLKEEKKNPWTCTVSKHKFNPLILAKVQDTQTKEEQANVHT